MTWTTAIWTGVDEDVAVVAAELHQVHRLPRSPLTASCRQLTLLWSIARCIRVRRPAPGVEVLRLVRGTRPRGGKATVGGKVGCPEGRASAGHLSARRPTSCSMRRLRDLYPGGTVEQKAHASRKPCQRCGAPSAGSAVKSEKQGAAWGRCNRTGGGACSEEAAVQAETGHPHRWITFRNAARQGFHAAALRR